MHSVLAQEDEAACATITTAITEKWMAEVARRKAEADKEKGEVKRPGLNLVPRMYTTYPTLRCHQGSVAQLVRVSD